MPRGTCENCGRHDSFLYPVPLAACRSVFVCPRCLNLPQAREENDDFDEDVFDGEDAEACISFAFLDSDH